MNIAVAYEDGQVSQHFGKTKQFMIFTIELGSIASSRLVDAGETGHEALAGFLAGQDVNTVICGGIGSGAQEALASCGIEVVSGVTGNTAKAVLDLLSGKLASEGVNCAGHEEGEGCGGNCGHCPGCHGQIQMLEGPNAGKTCRVHYRGTFNDGTQFDSSYDRGEPLEFICGIGQMISGFDRAVVGMTVGEQKDIHLSADEAYGEADPAMILTFPIAELSGAEQPEVGQQVYLSAANGQPIPVRVVKKDETTITLDANHEMAGKELNFHIELVEVL